MTPESLLPWLIDIFEGAFLAARDLWTYLPPAAAPFVILLLRTADQTTSTVRMLVINQGRHAAAAVLGLLQAFLFLGGVVGVLGNLADIWNLVAFAAGYGVGAVLGITIDTWAAPGHTILRVVSTGRGPALVQALRATGSGVTELSGKGRGGSVTVLLSAVPRRQIARARQTIVGIDPDAFISSQNVRVLQGGWLL